MKVAVNDITMEVQTRGTGIPVLLIHGFPLSSKIWEPQMGAIQGARLIAPDLRGFGGTEGTEGGYSMDLLAQDCLKLLDEMEIREPVIAAGLSMGGYAALSFYRQFRERVAGLILAATRPGADSEEGKAGRNKAMATAREGGAPAVADGMLTKMLSPKAYPNNIELVSRVRTIMESASFEGLIGALTGMRDRPDSTYLLEKMDIPVLIVHGADDQLIPVKEAEAMHSAVRGSRLSILPDAGHLCNMEQPELFNRAVEEFVKTVISKQ